MTSKVIPPPHPHVPVPKLPAVFMSPPCIFQSMKRTTPVGEEQPYITSPEGSRQKHDVHYTTGDKSRISSGGDKDQDDHS